MFDIAGSELLVVLVVAIVVVGPKDMPKLMRTAGQWAGRARAMADQFRRSFDDMARQAELEEMRAEVLKLQNEKSLTEIQRETDIMLGYLPADPVASADTSEAFTHEMMPTTMPPESALPEHVPAAAPDEPHTAPADPPLPIRHDPV